MKSVQAIDIQNIGQQNQLTKADFSSSQDIRWCPGCGDYAILASIQKVLPQLDTPKEKFVFVSGIGCSSRLPYYMDTYGFHTLHGRAPTVATGIKLANPSLSVWVITGDGDALSIGSNHLLHILRRNLDVNILLINNRIYGLTKGQYSPTSKEGKITKSSPSGSIDTPVNPISYALSAGATFVARAIDSDSKNLQQTLLEASRHRGASFVEIFQNCHIFNDGEFKDVTIKGTKEDKKLQLINGEPLMYGGEEKKVLIQDGFGVKSIPFSGDKLPCNAIIHDESDDSDAYSYMLSCLNSADLPIPVGVFKKVLKPSYEDLLYEQRSEFIAKNGQGNLSQLLEGQYSWTHN